MSSRYTKSIPEFVYFVGEREWMQGPFVHPKRGHVNRKFALTEVPMDLPKKKKAQSNENNKNV
jgi:hypothetical protein